MPDTLLQNAEDIKGAVEHWLSIKSPAQREVVVLQISDLFREAGLSIHAGLETISVGAHGDLTAREIGHLCRFIALHRPEFPIRLRLEKLGLPNSGRIRMRLFKDPQLSEW